MPAKRKLLPQPCPVCGADYGTIQLVIFPHSNSRYRNYSGIICRIGHYSPKHYRFKIKKATIDTGTGIGDYTHEENPVKTRGRVWHQFPITERYRGHYFDDISSLVKSWNKTALPLLPPPRPSGVCHWRWSLDDLEDNWPRHSKVSHTFSPSDQFLERIRKEGWPYVSSRRHRIIRDI